MQEYYKPESDQDLLISLGTHKKLKSPSAFLLDFPMRTNYMYARMKRSVINELFALTICLWVKAGTGPGLGTPFSYAVPGQANELVLIEWGSNPMELLINDKVKLPDDIRHYLFLCEDFLKKIVGLFCPLQQLSTLLTLSSLLRSHFTKMVRF